ncbi:hypothetical protein [Actinomadura kijaniata]|uniref:hypothetical protein n=1 Tax=Actinomadura kijaniata TaxID=46161 RepID=UPI00083674A4|nr:hypothetical protein [Actinomadura kijaniata]
MIEMLFLGGAAFFGSAHAVRQYRASYPNAYRAGPAARGTGRRTGRCGTAFYGRYEPPPSLLVKAWNSAGAPVTKETQLADAVADLGGRAIGKAVRAGARRWHRPTSRDPERGPGRGRPANGPTGGPSSGPGQIPPHRPGTPPPSFGGPAPSGGAAWPVPHHNPTGRPSSQPGASARPTGSASATGPGGSGARQRTRSRVWATGPPINMDPPASDVEFLETAEDLQRFLLGVAHAVQDYTEEVVTRRMPAAITIPLEAVGDDMVEASAAIQRAATMFEVIFEEAIDLAAAGIKFTGEDPE